MNKATNPQARRHRWRHEYHECQLVHESGAKYMRFTTVSRKGEFIICSVYEMSELIYLTGKKISRKQLPNNIHRVLFKLPLCMADTARAINSELASRMKVLKEVSSMSKTSRISEISPDSGRNFSIYQVSGNQGAEKHTIGTEKSPHQDFLIRYTSGYRFVMIKGVGTSVAHSKIKY